MSTALTRISSDGQASRLMPGGAFAQLSLVLFCRLEVDQVALDLFESAVPPSCAAFVVDVSGAPNTCRWFGVRHTPVLAAVADGALLMLETECGARACADVLAGARERLARLDEEVVW